MMDWKKRLLVNYVALGVGFTALLIAAVVTPKKGRIFVQESGFPSGPGRLEMEVNLAGDDQLKVDFYFKLDQPIRGLMELTFRVSARDWKGHKINVVSSEIGSEFQDVCNLADNPTDCLSRMFQRIEDGVYELRVVLLGKSLAKGRYKVLTAYYDTSQTDHPPYVFKVSHAGFVGSGANRVRVNYYHVKVGAEETDYDILSGVEGDLEVMYPSMPSTSTPVPEPSVGVSGFSISAEVKGPGCMGDGKAMLPVWIEVRNWPEKGGNIQVYRRIDGGDEILLYAFRRDRERFVNKEGRLVLKREQVFTNQEGKVTGAVYWFYHAPRQDVVEGKPVVFRVVYRTADGDKKEGEVVTDPVVISCLGGDNQVGSSLRLEYDPRNQGVKVLLRPNNMQVDSMDLVLGYSLGVAVDQNTPFVLNRADMGSQAVMTKRFVNVPARRVLVSITGIDLAGQKDEYVVGWFKVTREDEQNTQQINVDNEPSVWLLFTPGSTVDTNVNVKGEDVLVSVGSAVVVPPIGGGLPATPTPLPTEISTPIPTNTPVPTQIPTPTSGPTPQEVRVLMDVKLPVSLVHRIERGQVGIEDYRRLPVMLFVGQDDNFYGIMWNSLIYDQVRGAVVWMRYDYVNQVLVSNNQEAYISASDLQQANYYIVKVAGFLAKRIEKEDVNVECDENGQGDVVCKFYVREVVMLLGDVNAAGSGRSINAVDPVEDDLVKAYQRLFRWDQNVNVDPGAPEYKYLISELLWFGDDVINGFDTGKYAGVLSDTEFYIDWFEGKNTGVYGDVPSGWSSAADKRRFVNVKWFNLLDADGNRYLNAIDWSIVHNSFQQMGQGDLYEILNRGGQ